MNLNSKQEEAIHTTEGRVLVLAGAGSGKTRVIVQRIAHLISHKKVPPTAILGLTFTNKAAEEMRHRVAALIGPIAKQVTLSTFHSFCMQVLRREIQHLGYTRDFSLYDEGDLRRMVQTLAREMLGHEGELPSLAPTREAIARASHQTDPEEMTWHDQFSKEMHGRLQTLLKSHNAVSFDTLISLTIELFEKFPDVLTRYQERFRYLMIDEYQDTNPTQFRLAELLSARYRNLCVVGDDDQSIYGWRGADVRNILTFKADSIIKLEQNYRSTPAILNAANAVIAHNQGRHDKKLWTATQSPELIEAFHAPTDADEATAVIDRILHYRETLNLKWRDFAILYRSNALSRAFEMGLLNASHHDGKSWVRGIPYEVFGGLEFAERGEIKDLLAYLRTLANPQDEEALLRILNVPRRGISDDLLDKLTTENRATQVSLWSLLEAIADGRKELTGHPRGLAGIRNFIQLMRTAKARFASEKLAPTLTWLLESLDYQKAIRDDVKSDRMRDFKWENVQECVNALAQYEQETQEPSLQHFVSTTQLARQPLARLAKGAQNDTVQLMTLHSAKGLEFPFCFLVGLEDHILPHEKSLAITGLEEERRLFYVGITRARQKLFLSMARTRMRMGKAQPTLPSRFLQEIPAQLLTLSNYKLFT